jgi:hypothetical protein
MTDGALHFESMLAEAIGETGLTDWGPENFREPLSVLLRALNEEASLTDAGRLSIHYKLMRHLTNRLLIEQELRQHPEILSVPVKEPVFVIGLPRSGTTNTHKLLAQNPTYRAPAFWEMNLPAPAPDERTRSTDPRFAQAQIIVDEMYGDLATKAKAIHFMAPDEPHECHELVENMFMSRLFDPFYHIPSYARWIADRDYTEAYQYHRKQLQMLTWRCPAGHLLLKDPMHMFDLPALFSVYPDAQVVVTHRDPVKTIASFCSLSFMVRSRRTATPDKKQVGRHVLQKLATGIRRLIAYRANASTKRHFLDVHYVDMMADPVREAKRIGAYFGHELTSDGASRISKWVADHPQNQHGEHRYSLEEYGLSVDEVRAAFADYYSTYSVHRE